MSMLHTPQDWVILDPDGYAVRLATQEEVAAGVSDDGEVYCADPAPHCNDAQTWDTCRCCGADNRQYVGQDDTGDPLYQCGACGTINPTD
jgi:hypothetical protein